jgi:SAM-dependent methyltransferase
VTAAGEAATRQALQPEWRDQWTRFEDQERFLFEDWIAPATLADFAGREVLEGGCGGGQHTAFVSAVAASVTAVDLNTADLARQRRAELANVTFVDADLATMDLGRTFDVVLSIGVLHHTDDPDRSFANLFRHLSPGGTMIVWVYSEEGNALVRWLVEPARKLVLRHLPRGVVAALARIVTALLYPVVHTVYRLPFLSFLPFFEYFGNFRRLSFERNVLNVFDKLNAPQTRFVSRARAERWMSSDRFRSDAISIRRYRGVSWSLVGVRHGAGEPNEERRP